MNGWVTGNWRAEMLEKTPSSVCLPEPGSIWTPSQVTQASSCGFDCIAVKWGGAGGAGQIILLGGASGERLNDG